jgi:hypothetical protein
MMNPVRNNCTYRGRIGKLFLLAVALSLGVALLVSSAIFTVDMAAAVTPSGATTAKTYYLNWYDSLAEHGMNGDWVIIGNLEDSPATAQVFFGTESTPRFTYDIPARGRQAVEWPQTMGGPVRVVSPDGAALVVTQRVIYHDSFNEVAAVEEGSLDTSYYFTWYDSLPQNGMKGNWIMVSNVDASATDVDIYIGGNKMGTYPIPAGGQITPWFDNTIGGPVRVESLNNQRLVVSQRVLCNDGFNEVTGQPASGLDSIYFFTWYDMYRPSGFSGNWILISNLNDNTVHAQVFVGNSPSPRGTYTLPPHQSVPPMYPDLRDGPVRVVCTDCDPGQNILVSQRVLYKGSFEEVQGTTPSGLSDEQYFGWYDCTQESQMSGNWIMVANQGVGTAAVDIYLGDSPLPRESATIGEGDRVTPIYPEVKGGPVRVLSREKQPLMASQRVLYKNSFNELLGLTRESVGLPAAAGPDLRLHKLNTYWADYNDYQNRQLSVDMRIANKGADTALSTSVTDVTADHGVTVSTAVPLPVGDIEADADSGFTIKYTVPVDVTSFHTSLSARCQTSDGDWLNFSF